ncbi:DUF1566 domain-containing protein [Aquimonas sp.]|jgi:hypothetical protein|uniref:Lcl C-terminal domain-containing protein n=1 Tax=Aquimonas sp. TaxID=1872588 RepID=UPI0037BE3953
MSHRLHWAWLLALLSACAPTPPSAPDSPFVKIAANGEHLDLQQGPWACVLDRRSGLIWENKSDNETQHFAAATYSWYDAERSLGHRRLGTCHADKEQYPCDTSDLIEASRSKRLCGRTDWRLPRTTELVALLDPDSAAGDPRIATALFPFTQWAPYWTQDGRRDAYGDLQIAAIHFGEGRQLWLRGDLVARARLVAGPQSSKDSHAAGPPAAVQMREGSAGLSPGWPFISQRGVTP